MKDLVVYTAIIGNYDQLIDPPLDPECDYICFTDTEEITSSVFDVRLVQRQFKDPTRDARMYKVLSHHFLPEYRYSLWIDGSVTLHMTDIRNFVLEQLQHEQIAVTEIPGSDDLYQGLDVLLRHRKDDPDLMRAQMNFYRSEGYPSGIITSATGVIARDQDSPEIQNFNETWWREIVRHSKRDQISFNYVAWREKVAYRTMDKLAWHPETLSFTCKYFSAGPHRPIKPVE